MASLVGQAVEKPLPIAGDVGSNPLGREDPKAMWAAKPQVFTATEDSALQQEKPQ